MTRPIAFHSSALAIACALALALPAGAAHAQAVADFGYLTGNDATVARSAFGLCWHTGNRPQAASIEQCEPKVVPAPIALAPAPIAVAPAPVPEPAPAPIAAAEPVPVVVPPRVIERLTLDADTLFDFDRSDLRPAGRSALDAFAVRMKEIKPEMIMAIGYTDRLGSEAYNQQLSERRVAAVKTYLVGLGVGSDRVHTEGRGEAEPVTKPGECGGAGTKAVIACLQPDRRVVVEVMGDRIAQ